MSKPAEFRPARSVFELLERLPLDAVERDRESSEMRYLARSYGWIRTSRRFGLDITDAGRIALIRVRLGQ